MENWESIFKLGQIILVDLVLAGDNAIVIGLVAAKFTADYRRRIIFYGVAAAILLRIIFAVLTVQLLAITGLRLVGGLLLVWICWKLWTELRAADRSENQTTARHNSAKQTTNPPMLSAIWQIVVADISMSLDNVLAVASVADDNIPLLVLGLAIAVAMMLFAATLIANLLQKHQWIGYLGLAVIVYVAADMCYRGVLQLLPALN